MSVENTTAFTAELTANGVTTVFPWSFYAASADEIAVYQNGTIIASGFTVTRAADGTGSITFATAPASGTKIRIVSDPDFTQEVEFQQFGPFRPNAINAPLDRAAARDIWLKAQVDRAIKVPVGETPPVLTSLSDAEGDFLAVRDGQIVPVSVSDSTSGAFKANATALGIDPEDDDLGLFDSSALPDNATLKNVLIGLVNALAGDAGGSFVSAKLSGTGAVRRTITQIIEDYSNSVLGYGASGNGTDSDNAGIANAMAKYDEVFLPPTAGGYRITGSGVAVASGKTVRGVGGYEDDGTAFSVGGTIINLDPAATRAFSVLRGEKSTVDSVVFEGIAFNGANNDYAIYGDKLRQSQFRGLRFNNLKKCIYLNEDSWLIRTTDVKAFNFDAFFEGNSAFEDSTFAQVLARSYRAGSLGIYLNAFGQTVELTGVDISETTIPLGIVIGNGNCAAVLNSCYFEMGTQNTRGAITASAGDGCDIIVIANGCRWFDKSGGALANSTAFEGTGAGTGNVEFLCNGGTFTDLTRIAYDATGSAVSLVSGKGNIINSGTPAIYDGVRSPARRLRFAGLANAYNLQAIGGVYTINKNFGAGGTQDIVFPDASVTGLYEIVITGAGAPNNRAVYYFQPKGGFSNGLTAEKDDADSNFAATATANTVTITATAAADVQILARKIA